MFRMEEQCLLASFLINSGQMPTHKHFCISSCPMYCIYGCTFLLLQYVPLKVSLQSWNGVLYPISSHPKLRYICKYTKKVWIKFWVSQKWFTIQGLVENAGHFLCFCRGSTHDFEGVSSWSDDTSVGHVVGNSSRNCLSTDVFFPLLRAATAIIIFQKKQCLAPLAKTTALLEVPDPEKIRLLFQVALWETFTHRCQFARSLLEVSRKFLEELVRSTLVYIWNLWKSLRTNQS